VAEHLRIAQEYERQERVDKALEQYESVRELDARNVRILGKIAECYSKQQSASRAVPVFLEMMDVYRERGILSKAIEVAKLALQRFPRDVKLQETLAQIYVQRGMAAEALWMYRKLAEQEPGEPRYASTISRLEKDLGVTKAAAREKKPAAEKPAPRTPPAPQAGRAHTAPRPSPRMTSRKSKGRSGRSGEPSLQEAVRAFRLGKYAKCLDTCRQIIPACSAASNVDTLLQTNALEARCLIKMGNTKEAIKTCMQALSIGGVHQERAIELRYLLGVALEADGQQDQALAVYKKVLQINPNYADVKSRMAWTRMSAKASSAE
jgi:tetratricopeptide (TPR) repeat protein